MSDLHPLRQKAYRHKSHYPPRLRKAVGRLWLTPAEVVCKPDLVVIFRLQKAVRIDQPGHCAHHEACIEVGPLTMRVDFVVGVPPVEPATVGGTAMLCARHNVHSKGAKCSHNLHNNGKRGGGSSGTAENGQR